VADSAEPKSIDEIKSYGVIVLPATKGQGSINQGIQYIQEQKISVTKRSTNLWKEYNNYLWVTDRDGKILNVPQDFMNHCFTGNTLISTVNGEIPMKEIKEGDLVLTTKGYKKVLKKWNNGKKLVNDYWLQTDTANVKLSATKEHLVKQENKWTEISSLQLEKTIYLNRNLMEKFTDSTQKKDISQEESIKCTKFFGNSTMVQSLKGFISTIKIKTAGITELITLNLLKLINIYHYMEKKDLKTKSLQKSFSKEELKKQKSGINQKKAKIGTSNMVKILGRIENIKPLFAKFVQLNTKQDIKELPNFVVVSVKLKHLEIGQERLEEVYDLTIEDEHEYFANGVLVHNCLDSLRYGFDKINPDNQIPRIIPQNNFSQWTIN
jgi:hypothetical protein